ncbi:MAG: tRNA pseudouridine(55) synthase TruB, partial [Thiobacillus sp.]|nr:tRNA pseudouridine(55) synthase TruB [Thiobacillus sp.]
HTLTELDALDAPLRPTLLLPADCLVAHLPALELDAAETAALCQGRNLAHATAQPGLHRVYATSGAFMGLADSDGASLTPRRLVATQQA